MTPWLLVDGMVTGPSGLLHVTRTTKMRPLSLTQHEVHQKYHGCTSCSSVVAQRWLLRHSRDQFVLVERHELEQSLHLHAEMAVVVSSACCPLPPSIPSRVQLSKHRDSRSQIRCLRIPSYLGTCILRVVQAPKDYTDMRILPHMISDIPIAAGFGSRMWNPSIHCHFIPWHRVPGCNIPYYTTRILMFMWSFGPLCSKCGYCIRQFWSRAKSSSQRFPVAPWYVHAFKGSSHC